MKHLTGRPNTLFSICNGTKFVWIVNESERFCAAGQRWNCDNPELDWAVCDPPFLLAHEMFHVWRLYVLWQYSPCPKIFSSVSISVTWILSCTVLSLPELGWAVAPVQLGGLDTTGVSPEAVHWLLRPRGQSSGSQHKPGSQKEVLSGFPWCRTSCRGRRGARAHQPGRVCSLLSPLREAPQGSLTLPCPWLCFPRTRAITVDCYAILTPSHLCCVGS